MKKCLNVIRLKEQFTPQKIINQILILKCQRNVNSKTDDVTTGGLDLQHHTNVCLHLKIKAVFINHDPSSAWTESSELNRTFTTDLSEQSLMVQMWWCVLFGVKHSVSSSTEPAEPRGPCQHTVTEPPAGQHAGCEELIADRTWRTSSLYKAKYTTREVQETSEPTECTTDIFNRTREMETRE